MSLLPKLSNHPVFQGTSSVTSSSHLEKIASRGDDELFIANGQKIRCCDCNGTNYKLLNTDEINFEIESLKINDSGTLIAAYNQHEVVISTLPSPGFMENFSQDTIPVKTYRIVIDQDILDLSFNSMARYDSELVILSSDNYIRTFDLTLSSEVPQFELNLSHTSNAFGLTNIVTNPVSICLGSTSQQNPSACLTLYIFNSDGDIYTIYPFVPTCLTVTNEFVMKLFDQTTLLLQNCESESTKLELLQQLKYVSTLLKNLEIAQKEIKIDIEGNLEELFHIPAPRLKTSLKLQGPFSISPFPNVLYNFDGVGIDHIPCGDIDIILTTWSNGNCLLLMQDQELIMRWNGIENDEYNLELTLTALEYIQVTEKGESDIQIAGTSVLTPFQFFIVLQNSKLINVDFQKWGDLLNKSIVSGDSSLFLDTVVKSKLSLLSDESFFEGFTVLGTSQNTYLIKLGKDNVDVIEVKDETRDDEIKLKSEKLKETVVVVPRQHQSFLAGPFTELTDLLKTAKLSNDFKLNTNTRLPISIEDETSLKDMGELANFFVKRISTLQRIGLNMHFRIQMEHEELTSQLNILVEDFNNDKMDLKFQQIEKMNSRLEEIISKQTTSIERLNNLNVKVGILLEQQSSRTKNLQLSKEEKNWFNQIEFFTRQLESLKLKYEQYTQQLNFIKNVIHTNGINEKSIGGNYNQIKNKLLKEKKLVDFVGSALGDDILEVEDLISFLKIQS